MLIFSVDDVDADPTYKPFGECKNEYSDTDVQNSIIDHKDDEYSRSSSVMEPTNNEYRSNGEKRRYKYGKRTHMSKRKKLGLDYENRRGKLFPQKVFTPINQCCKNKCFINLISEKAQRKIFEEYYQLGDVYAQDKAVLDGIQITDKKRSTTIYRKIQPIQSHDRQISVKYCLPVNGRKENICKKLFQNTFGIGRGKIDVMVQKKRSSLKGISPKDGRGLHKPHNYNPESREIILNHIKSFPVHYSHYSRKNTCQLYLSPLLNIQKMYHLYKEYCETNGINKISSYWLYRTIFSETGLKFKMPYVNACKVCDELKIKATHVAEIELETLKSKNQEHQDMVDTVYNSKKFGKIFLDTNLTLEVRVFNLQQCLSTPDLKKNSVFYEWQLWTYNETIRDIEFNTSYCYVCHETGSVRRSDQTASVLYKFIEDNVSNHITHLITYADTCSGENRNMNVALMFMLAIQNHPRLQVIDQKFLVHTHLECDCDCARIEWSREQLELITAIPMDWYSCVKDIRGKWPRNVIEMGQNFFKSFSTLLPGPLRANDIEMEKIDWLRVKWLRYDNQYGVVKFKYTLDVDTPFQILDLRKGAVKTNQNCSALNLSISNTYERN